MQNEILQISALGFAVICVVSSAEGGTNSRFVLYIRRYTSKSRTYHTKQSFHKNTLNNDISKWLWSKH